MKKKIKEKSLKTTYSIHIKALYKIKIKNERK